MDFISKLFKSKKDDEKMKTVESCDFKLMKDAETDFKTGFYARKSPAAMQPRAQSGQKQCCFRPVIQISMTNRAQISEPD